MSWGVRARDEGSLSKQNQHSCVRFGGMFYLHTLDTHTHTHVRGENALNGKTFPPVHHGVGVFPVSEGALAKSFSFMVSCFVPTKQ